MTSDSRAAAPARELGLSVPEPSAACEERDGAVASEHRRDAID
jgi:hypothetical protein